MSANSSLETKVDEIEDKANKYDTRTNVEDRVKEAKSDIRTLNRELDTLDDELKELRFYSNVLTEVFGENLPTEVGEAHSVVRSVTEVTPNELVSKIQNNRVGDHTSQVRGATSKVQSACQEVTEELSEIQSTWESKTGSAKAIQRIIGGEGEIHSLVSEIEDIVQTRIWDPKTTDISTLKKDWQGAKKRWESGVGIDWEGLQKRYDLSDETISRLKNLSGGNEIYLSELEDVVMDDIMRVNDLRKAMKISI